MLQNILQEYRSCLEKRDSSKHTIEGYVSDLKKFSRWYEGTTGSGVEISAIGSLDIAEFKRYLLNMNQSPATINRALAALSSFFSWAVNNGLAESNPVANVKMVRQVQLAPRSLTRLDLLALMRSVTASGKKRDIALVSLLFHAGLRVSEVCGLDLSDVMIRERSGWVTVRFGKGGRVRQVPLNATTRRALLDWLEERGNKEGPLFFSQKGGGLKRRAVERIVEKYARRAGLAGVSPHTLRHTFCRKLLEEGVSLNEVALLAGHTSLNTTARYTVPRESDLEKSVDKLSWE